MSILVACRLNPDVVAGGLGGRLHYRPELEEATDSALAAALGETGATVVVARRAPRGAGAAAWRRAAGGREVAVVLGDADGAAAPGLRVSPAPASRPARDAREADLGLLAAAEREFTRAAVARPARDIVAAVRPAPPGRPSTVLMVGAGVVNLITALTLARHGYSVRILEGGTDPFTAGVRADDCGVGATLSGGDARMFTLTEADNYNEKGSLIYAQMRDVCRRTVHEGGWLVKGHDRVSADERAWVDAFASLPAWAASAYADDIYLFNRESGGLWDVLMRDEPGLFAGVGLTPGVLRLYSHAPAFEAAVALQTDLGAARAVLSAAEVARRYPSLRSACEAGRVAGGIEVVGFTLNVHRFAARLIARLKRAGVRVEWGVRAEALLRDGAGRVSGVSAGGVARRADHYVVSPGAYGNPLLAGTASANACHGMLGVWLALPHSAPKLSRSLKIHREGHQVEDANVTLARGAAGEPVLLVGAGYGYTGRDPKDIDPDELERVFEGARSMAAEYLPAAYREAESTGRLRASRSHCVRPFTATGLGVFEVMEAEGGGLALVTGGHNTGGFTQSPSVGLAVLSALRGLEHPMHQAYHPDRPKLWAPAATSGRPARAGA